MADRIEFGQVEGVVGSHDDAFRAVEAHQLGELVRREHHRVEIDLPEVAGRRPRQIAVRIGARAPGVIDAAGIGRQVTAAVHRENLQLGMPFEHAVEDQIMQRDGGLERVANHVVEIEAREPSAFGEAVGMNDDERAERLGRLPERRVLRLREFVARHVGQDLGALHAE